MKCRFSHGPHARGPRSAAWPATTSHFATRAFCLRLPSLRPGHGSLLPAHASMQWYDLRTACQLWLLSGHRCPLRRKPQSFCSIQARLDRGRIPRRTSTGRRLAHLLEHAAHLLQGDVRTRRPHRGDQDRQAVVLGKHQKPGGQSTTPPSRNRLKSRRSTIDSVGGSRDFLLHNAH